MDEIAKSAGDVLPIIASILTVLITKVFDYMATKIKLRMEQTRSALGVGSELVDAAGDMLAANAEAIDALVKRVADIEERLAQRDKEIRRLQQVIDEREQEIRRLNARIMELERSSQERETTLLRIVRALRKQIVDLGETPVVDLETL